MSRPFIPVYNTVSVELIYGYWGQTIENVLHIEGSAPFSASDLVTVRNGFIAWDTATWRQCRPTGSILNRIRTKALDSIAAPMEDYALPSPHAGLGSGVNFPGNVTFCLKLATGLAGRSQRGRLFLPGVDGGNVSGNQMVAASANVYAAAINTLLTTINGWNAAWHLVVTSYRKDKTWRAAGHNTTVTQCVYTDLNLDAQRRRLTGRGRA